MLVLVAVLGVQVGLVVLSVGLIVLLWVGYLPDCFVEGCWLVLWLVVWVFGF